MVQSETRRDTRDPVSARSAAAERSYTSLPSAGDVATSVRSPRAARCARQVTSMRTESASVVYNKDTPLHVLYEQFRFFVDRPLPVLPSFTYNLFFNRLDRFASK